MNLFLSLGLLICLLPQIYYCDTNKTSPSYYDGNRHDSFDWDILKALEVSSTYTGNVVISSLSIKLLLAILNEGVPSNTFTAEQLRNVLGFTNVTEIRHRFGDILSITKEHSSSYELNIASKIYVDESFSLRPEFIANAENYYQCTPNKISVNDIQKTKNEINDWVKKESKGKITDIVSEDDLKQTIMLLLNTIYYKGQWAQKFPVEKTFKGRFYLSNQEIVNDVEYMHNTGTYKYFESPHLDAKILRIPYKESPIAMYILLPNTKTGLRRLIRQMTNSIAKTYVYLMDDVNIDVILPKFKFGYKSQFSAILQKMGLTNIFRNTAHFDNLYQKTNESRNRPFVSSILQKASIEIDEEGSVASASTQVILTNKFGAPDYVFNASNPFLFYIEDESIGAVLFSGKIENPNQAEEVKFPDEINPDAIVNRFASTDTNRKEELGGESAMGTAGMNIKYNTVLFFSSIIYLILFS